MSVYTAKVSWERSPTEAYTDNRYSRAHSWHFDGGVVIPASASPHVVPLPYSVEENVDPEEAYIASISSCHMLTFLSIAAKQKYVLDTYSDECMGVMELNKNKKMSVTKVTLRPKTVFSGDKQPSESQLEKMHHLAHEECFIANSVKTEIVTEIG